MKRPTLLVLCGSICLASCPKKTPDPVLGPSTSLPSATSRRPEASKDLNLRRPDAVPAVVVSVDPAGVPALQALVGRFAQHLPPMVKGQLRPLLAAADLWALVRVAARLSGIQGVLPTRLDGWDPGRKVVVELFEPTNAGDLALAGRVLITAATTSWVPGLCHRVRLPATDVGVAAASVRRVLEGLGLDPVPTRRDRKGVLFQREDVRLVAVLPEKDHVRIEICDRPVVLSGEPKDAREIWEQTVLGPPGNGPLPRTPARDLAQSKGQVLSLHLRPWAFRDVSSQWGTRMIMQALSHADPAQRQALMAMGLSEVSMGWLLMSPVGAEVEDASVALNADANGLRLTAIWSLTDQGRRVYQAAIRHAGSPFPVRGTGMLMHGWAAIDTKAMLDRATPPFLFRAAKRPVEVVRPIQEAGYWGMLHVMIRHQVGTLKALLGGLLGKTKPGFLSRLPRALGVAVEEIAQPPKSAVAITVPDGLDPIKMKQQLLKLPVFNYPGLSVRIRKHRGGSTALLLGLKSDPRRVFASKPRSVPQGVLGEMFVDGRRLAHNLTRMNPLFSRPLGELASIRSRVSARDHALVGEMLVDLRGGKRVSYATLPSNAKYRWTTPGLAYAGSKGGQCLNRMTESMIMGFKALAGAAPEFKMQLLVRALEEASRQLDCAEKDPLTREDAVKLRALVVLFQADRLGAVFKRTEQLALLSRACKRGLRPACTREREIRATAPVRLASNPGGCLPFEPDLFGRADRSHFVVTANGKTRPGVSARDHRLLVVDAAAPARAVIQSLQAATPADGSMSWGIVFRGPRGLNAVPVVTSGAPTKAQSLRLPAAPWEKVLPGIIKAACGPKATQLTLR